MILPVVFFFVGKPIFCVSLSISGEGLFFRLPGLAKSSGWIGLEFL
jgi:hypothetical protein